MKRKYTVFLLAGIIVLSACKKTEETDAVLSAGAEAETESIIQAAVQPTITFEKGVQDQITHGDKYNYYALEGKAEGFDRVTAIIEGTAVDFRNTDNQWYFTYPYPGPSVETEITFTTDPDVQYGQTGIELSALDSGSYVTLLFKPNENPLLEEPAVTAAEGQPHTFRSDAQGIEETVTVTNMETVSAPEEMEPLGGQLLKVEIHYQNDGTATTYLAPNYFSATDKEGHFLPLRYKHFWLKKVAPGQSFSETIYFDVLSEGPYSVRFFDGAWEESGEPAGTEI